MEIETLFYILIIAIMVASLWKIFEKAGRPGWESLIPIYSSFVLVSIIKKPWYWALLMMIPFLGIIWGVWSTNLLSKSFGKEEGFTLGLIFLPFIFYPMLGFGDAEYQFADQLEEAEIISETESE